MIYCIHGSELFDEQMFEGFLRLCYLFIIVLFFNSLQPCLFIYTACPTISSQPRMHIKVIKLYSIPIFFQLDIMLWILRLYMPLFKVFLFDFGWLHDTLNSIYIILFYNNNFFFCLATLHIFSWTEVLVEQGILALLVIDDQFQEKVSNISALYYHEA